MNELVQFISKHGYAFSMLTQTGVLLLVLYFQTKFAPKSLEREVADHQRETEDRFHELDKRMSSIEDDLTNLPSKDEFHNLNLQMCDLAGELKRVDEKFAGLVQHMKRTEKQLGLIDQYIRETK